MFVVAVGPPPAIDGYAPPEAPKGEIGLFLAGNHTEFTYAGPATVTSNTIDADLGALGRISVTRVPTGRIARVRRGCKPKRRTRVALEHYEGTIEFHGEEGFTDVSATSVPRDYSGLVACGIPEGGRPPGPSLPGARLDAELGRGEDRVELTATQGRPGARTYIGAEVEEHRGEVEIHRAVGGWASAGILRYDQHLRTATLTPDPPFAGHASFHRNVRSTEQWTGNLTVDLPGLSNQSLTGPGYRAELRHPTARVRQRDLAAIG
jgi:hypothetical protein